LSAMSSALRRLAVVTLSGVCVGAALYGLDAALRSGLVPSAVAGLGPLGRLGPTDILIAAATALVTFLLPFGIGARAKGGRAPGRGAAPDPLTGLPDRAAFRQRLEAGVARARNEDGQLAVVIAGLDHFRSVNDTFGHAVGDAVLKLAAERLGRLVPAGGLVARLSGDEFGLIVAGDANPRSARHLAGRIVEELGEPYAVEGVDVSLSASVGVALYPVNADNAESLFRAADLALSKARAEGRQTWRFFDTEMERQLKSRTRLERDLRKALQNDEFVIFYQPQMDLKTGDLIGYEALIRWERPGEGIVSPGAFIPVAEETGLIKPLGEWVLRRACADAAQWIEKGTVAVNFSAAQFRYPGVDQAIERALADSGLEASRLEIEITESVFLEHSPEIMATLRRIKALGVRIAMDDFGTGYSSLSHLTRFPFDKIKIDRSFVAQVAEDESIGSIIASVVGLGRSLSVDIAAEGVETAEQVTLLRAAGCSIVQGFLFGLPQRADRGAPADRRRVA